MHLDILSVEQTEYTPKIRFDRKNQRFTCSGSSYMEYPFEFYKPIVGWLEDYLKATQAKISLDFYLDYWNTGSIRLLMFILDFLEKQQRIQLVNWYFENGNQDAFYLGENLQEEFSDVIFNIIEVDNSDSSELYHD
ncbi:hypothetical protein BKI52_28740 [marine bacterium AO1-C]|nr:hypothetical protein BKI52_28740 [marine bacterium AO1-C]